MIGQDEEDEDNELEESVMIINKELNSLDPTVQQVLAGDHECKFKHYLEQSELARNHLESLLS